MSFSYTQKSKQDFNYAAQAVGFGVRYKTPLGPVRLDLAWALNPPRYEGFSTNVPYQDLLKCTPDQINVLPQCTAGPQRLTGIQFFFSIGQAF
jgi:outer membrane protein insertion porin family